jgi:hypothetical protein
MQIHNFEIAAPPAPKEQTFPAGVRVIDEVRFKDLLQIFNRQDFAMV